jgi:glycosyltransferase involved in cell wall biosynthesis
LNGPFQPLACCSVAKSAADAIGGFDESSLLQRDSGLDFLLRLTRRFPPVIAGTVAGTAAPHAHAFDTAGATSSASKDVARRYAARSAPDPRIPQGREPEFVADLNHRERERLSPLLGHFELPSSTSKALKPQGGKPLRITVATGPWDYHHNWLCFYNYLEYLQGSGFATHKTVLDGRATEQDLSNSDLVILSRAKSDNVADIIQSCRRRGIPTIYMIDDNWFSVGRDWPEQYSQLFADDGPIMRNFLAGVQGADAVLTYNPLLVEDLLPHARKVVTLPNSVDIERFERVPRGKGGAEFVIGYAGSPRFSDAAFEALAQVARRRNVQVALLGDLAPRQLALFQGINVIRRGFTDYENYLKTLRELRLDILLAPLDFSRTSRSKCPNKYLEITAAGGIGVYSKVEPYTWYVQNDRNGVLVADSEDPAAWRRAILGLMDRRKLDRLQRAARADVLENYSSRKVAGLFADLLSNVIAEGARA